MHNSCGNTGPLRARAGPVRVAMDTRDRPQCAEVEVPTPSACRRCQRLAFDGAADSAGGSFSGRGGRSGGATASVPKKFPPSSSRLSRSSHSMCSASNAEGGGAALRRSMQGREVLHMA